MCTESCSLGRHLLTPIVTSLPWNLSPTVSTLPPLFTSVTHMTRCRLSKTHTHTNTIMQAHRTPAALCLTKGNLGSDRESKGNKIGLSVLIIVNIQAHVQKCAFIQRFETKLTILKVILKTFGIVSFDFGALMHSLLDPLIKSKRFIRWLQWVLSQVTQAGNLVLCPVCWRL